tara:strand:+ start:2596 stop:2820 length:225 start_codon:yes stop_codon:yes gene_type:complete
LGIVKIKKNNVESIIKKKIKDSHYHKFSGISPEGFVMIPEKTLERLKDFDFWKEWKHNEEILKVYSIKDTEEDF